MTRLKCVCQCKERPAVRTWYAGDGAGKIIRICEVKCDHCGRFTRAEGRLSNRHASKKWNAKQVDLWAKYREAVRVQRVLAAFLKRREKRPDVIEQRRLKQLQFAKQRDQIARELGIAPLLKKRGDRA